jgi:NLR family CARD domain-containing protein 3
MSPQGAGVAKLETERQVLAMDKFSDQDVELALLAAAEDGGTPLNLSRINLVGQGRAGKTAFSNLLAGKPFETTLSTVGVQHQIMSVTKAALQARQGGLWSSISGGDGSGTTTAEEAQVQLAAGKLRQGNLLHMTPKDVQSHGNIVDLLISKHEAAIGAAAAELSNTSVTMQAQLVQLPVHGNSVASKLASVDPSSRLSLHESLKRPMGSSGEDETKRRCGRSASQTAVTKIDKTLVLNMAKSGAEQPLRLSIWDFGGQEHFNVLHHLYLTRYCLFVVMFNMEWLCPRATEGEKEACLTFLRFWMNSIAIHAVDPADGSIAPILIVGTHKDKVPSPKDHMAISKTIYDFFSSSHVWASVVAFACGTIDTGAGLLYFFPINNTAIDDPVVSDVRAAVLSCLCKEDYVQRKVPFEWMHLLDQLRGKDCMSLQLDEVLKIGAECGLPTTTLSLREETLLALRLYNEIGVLMHHPETALQHVVILDPAAYLVTPAATVICQHGYHELDVHKAARKAKHKAYDRLCKRGILSKELLAVLWRDYSHHSPELQLIMVKHGLLVPLLELQAASVGSHYLVPALLPEADGSSSAEHKKGLEPFARALLIFATLDVMSGWRERGYTTVQEVAKEGFLPNGLFSQFMGRVMRECQCVHGMQFEDLDLCHSHLDAAFGNLYFTVRVVPQLNVLEVLFRSANTLPIIERLVALVGEAIASTVPKLSFALAATAHDAGAWRKGDAPYEEGEGGRELVILDGPQGVIARIEDKATVTVVVGRGKRLSRVAADELFRHFQGPGGLLESYHVFLSYRWGQFDSKLVTAIFSLLARQTLRQEHVQVQSMHVCLCLSLFPGVASMVQSIHLSISRGPKLQ